MTLALLRAMQDSKLDGDTVAYNAAISAWDGPIQKRNKHKQHAGWCAFPKIQFDVHIGLVQPPTTLGIPKKKHGKNMKVARFFQTPIFLWVKEALKMEETWVWYITNTSRQDAVKLLGSKIEFCFFVPRK